MRNIRHALLSSALLVFSLSVTAYASSADVIRRGPWVDIREYEGDLPAAVLASRGKKLLIGSPTKILTASMSIPDDVQIEILQGGSITTSPTTTLIINGPYTGFLGQNFTGSGVVVFGVGSVKEVYPQWWGAKGDGRTDCTLSIQRAIAALANTGGTVYFSTPGKYRISGQINIQSRHPIHLVSDMVGGGQVTANSGSYILIGETWDGSVFKYSAPTASRWEAGGGTVRGLAFYDPTFSHAITSCLDLYDFNFSRVENCSFYQIKGSAIKTSYCVMTNFSGLIIRACGDISRPAFHIAPTDASHTTQSVVIAHSKMEVNHSAPYISINRYAQNIKIIGLGFEGDESKALTNQNFIYINATDVSVSDCHFNRNSAVQVHIADGAGRVMINSSTFMGWANTTPALIIAGNHNIISHSIFASGKQGDEIRVTGHLNIISSCNFVRSGGISFSGHSNQIDNSTFYVLTTTNAYWMTLVDGCSANGNILRGAHTGISGGIKLSGAVAKAVGNTIYQLAGEGIKNEGSSSIINGNGIFDH